VTSTPQNFQTARPTIYDAVSWILMGTGLLLVLLLRLLPGLLVGLATYELVRVLVKLLNIVKIHRIRAKMAAVSLVALSVVAFIIAATLGIISFLQTDSLPMLLSKLADSLQSWQHVLPASLAERLPDSYEELRQVIFGWVPLHFGETQASGGRGGACHCTHSFWLGNRRVGFSARGKATLTCFFTNETESYK
jgi:predicted PurR-regulated permease PerM